MLKADLHTHSTVSDGSASIAEIIELAVRKGLGAVAVTDHDTLLHIPLLPRRADIQVIGGIEMSGMDKTCGMRAHILGYGIGDIDAVEALARPHLEARHATSLRQMEILKTHGFRFDVDSMRKAHGRYIYKQHIMEYLVRTGQAEEMFGAFYWSTFKNGGVCAIDIEYIDVFEAVRTVKRAGGQAVLAHPGQQQNFYLVPELVRCGLNGIELNHPSHGQKDRETIKKLAEEYGLYLTGGSDFHGSFSKKFVDIGDYVSEESGIDALC